MMISVAEDPARIVTPLYEVATAVKELKRKGPAAPTHTPSTSTITLSITHCNHKPQSINFEERPTQSHTRVELIHTLSWTEAAVLRFHWTVLPSIFKPVGTCSNSSKRPSFWQS